MAYGARRKLHGKFKFVVTSNKFGNAQFSKMSELSVEAADIDYFEGGAIIPIKEPGRLTFADVTLERGSSQDFVMHNWFLEVANAAIGPGGQGEVTPDYKTDDVAVTQRDRDNRRMREWQLMGAYPKKYVAGDWDNTADEVVIEQLVLRHDWFAAV